MLYFKNPMASLFIRSWPLINKHYRDAQKHIKMKQGGLGIDKTMTLFVKAEYLMDDIIHQKYPLMQQQHLIWILLSILFTDFI